MGYAISQNGFIKIYIPVIVHRKAASQFFNIIPQACIYNFFVIAAFGNKLTVGSYYAGAAAVAYTAYASYTVYRKYIQLVFYCSCLCKHSPVAFSFLRPVGRHSYSCNQTVFAYAPKQLRKTGGLHQHLPPSSDASPTGNRVPECRKGNQTDMLFVHTNLSRAASANVRSKDAENTTEYQSKCGGKYSAGKRGSMEIWK